MATLTLGEKVEKLEERTQALENRIWVAVTVCTILGIAALASVLFSKMYSNVEAVATARQHAIDDIRNEAPSIIKEAARTSGVLPQLFPGHSGDGCEVVGDWQLCWGTHNVTTNAKGEIYGGDHFDFGKPFRDGTQPSVVISIKNTTHNGSTADYGTIGITTYTQSTTGMDFTTISNPSVFGPMTASLSYTATGFAQPPR